MATSNSSSGALIEFDKVVAGYTHLTILNELTLDARKGEITLLIGPNGAGKSTVLKTLFGMLTPRSGEVRMGGKVINGRTPRQLLGEGMAFVPQGRNLFGSLSVLHNLELGGLQLPKKVLKDRIEEVMAQFPRLRERVDSRAASLSSQPSGIGRGSSQRRSSSANRASCTETMPWCSQKPSGLSGPGGIRSSPSATHKRLSTRVSAEVPLRCMPSTSSATGALAVALP